MGHNRSEEGAPEAGIDAALTAAEVVETMLRNAFLQGQGTALREALAALGSLPTSTPAADQLAHLVGHLMSAADEVQSELVLVAGDTALLEQRRLSSPPDSSSDSGSGAGKGSA